MLAPLFLVHALAPPPPPSLLQPAPCAQLASLELRHDAAFFTAFPAPLVDDAKSIPHANFLAQIPAPLDDYAMPLGVKNIHDPLRLPDFAQIPAPLDDYAIPLGVKNMHDPLALPETVLDNPPHAPIPPRDFNNHLGGTRLRTMPGPDLLRAQDDGWDAMQYCPDSAQVQIWQQTRWQHYLEELWVNGVVGMFILWLYVAGVILHQSWGE